MMVDVEDLSISFAGKTIISGLGFKVKKGLKATLKGRSGSGKSSVLMSLLGFVIPTSGKIVISGLELNRYNIKQIRSITAWVPQEMGFNLVYARDLLLLPFSFKHNKSIQPTEDEIGEGLEKFELSSDIMQKNLKDLSGGEKQRVSLCSAFLQNKPLLLLDEPTSALDASTKTTVTKLFTENNSLTIVSASHDDYWAKHNDSVIDITKYH